MRIKSIVAIALWRIRKELDVNGSADHDWWLAEQFLQKHIGQFDDDDIYLWFIQLEENAIPREVVEEDRELSYNENIILK